MIDFFKPDDFSFESNNPKSLVEQFADQANKLLEEKCFRVTGGENERYGWLMATEGDDTDTHESLMLPPWEIKKKCVEHEPPSGLITYPPYKYAILARCKHCGVKLKANWVEVKDE